MEMSREALEMVRARWNEILDGMVSLYSNEDLIPLRFKRKDPRPQLSKKPVVVSSPIDDDEETPALLIWSFMIVPVPCNNPRYQKLKVSDSEVKLLPKDGWSITIAMV